MPKRLVWLLSVVILTIACQKHGEPGFAEGRQTFRQLLALRDQISKQFHETVADVSVGANQRMTVKLVDSPVRSRTREEKQQHADAVAAFVLDNYKQSVSSVAIQFDQGETYVGRTLVDSSAP